MIDLAAALLAAFVTIVRAAPADGATYCVQAPGCVGTSIALQGALTAAALSADDDTIEIGPGTLAGTGFSYSPGADGGALTVVGAGQSQTILTGVEAVLGYVFQVSSDDAHHVTHISDLGIDVPQTNGDTVGLSIAFGVVERVRISSSGSGGRPTGFALSSSTLRDSTSDVDVASTSSTGIVASSGSGMPGSSVENVIVAGSFGIVVDAGSARISRTRVRASQEGITACNAEARVDNIVIEILGTAVGLSARADEQCGTSPAALNAKHVTIFGDGTAGGLGLLLIHFFHDASLELRHSVIRGVDKTISWGVGSGTGTATVRIGSTDADLGAGAQSGTPGNLVDLTGNINADPRFVDAAGGDYRLRDGSPAIDAGPSEPLESVESPVDLDGNPRIADGNDDGIAARDMGAYELHDACPTDPGKIVPGSCGCGAADTDANANGVADCLINADLKALLAQMRTLLGTLTGQKTPAQAALKSQLNTVGQGIVDVVQARGTDVVVTDAKVKLDKLAKRLKKRTRAATRVRGKALRGARKRALAAIDALDQVVRP